MSEILLKPIGVVRSPFSKVEGMPIQASAANGVKGSIELKPEYMEGLKDIDGFSHLILIYHFHRCAGYSLHVTPFLDQTPHGVFATRVPRRPNGIGLSIVRLIGISENLLEIEDVDILDQTPLLDIKPFVPEFDHRDAQRTGWFTDNARRAAEVRADGRFSQKPD